MPLCVKNREYKTTRMRWWGRFSQIEEIGKFYPSDSILSVWSLSCDVYLTKFVWNSHISFYLTIQAFLDKFWGSYVFLLILDNLTRIRVFVFVCYMFLILEWRLIFFNMLVTEKSNEAFRQALESVPGGVNGPVRAFGGVGGNPPFIESGRLCFNCS